MSGSSCYGVRERERERERERGERERICRKVRSVSMSIVHLGSNWLHFSRGTYHDDNAGCFRWSGGNVNTPRPFSRGTNGDVAENPFCNGCNGLLSNTSTVLLFQ